MYKYISAFGTKLTANDFQTLARRGGTAWMNAKPEALGPIAVVAADIGASGAGTTLMTLQQLQMGANTLSKQQGEVLEQLGLLDMSKVTRTGFGGGRLQVGAGGIKGSLEHMGDLPGWIKDVVYPAIDKAAHGDEAMIQALIAKLSPNRNAAKLIEMFGSKGFLDQQFKDIGLAGMQEPASVAYEHYISRNPEGVKKKFGEQYESMMQAIGAPIMQAATPGYERRHRFIYEHRRLGQRASRRNKTGGGGGCGRRRRDDRPWRRGGRRGGRLDDPGGELSSLR